MTLRKPEQSPARVLVRFIHANGRVEEHDAAVGNSLLDCALDNGVEGIIGQCGGGMNCATCHCYVAASWRAQMPEQDPDEKELLYYVEQACVDSRLACQIWLTPALDGLVVRLPESQFPG